MYSLGVDLGGTAIKAGLVDEGGRILARETLRINSVREPAAVIRDAADMARAICAEQGVDPASLQCVGFGAPGFIDYARGRVRYCPNLDFHDVPVCDVFRGAFPYPDVPMFLENDANCAAIAEALEGSGKGYDMSATMTLGTGVGLGIITHGRLYVGHEAIAPEFGHTTLSIDGEPCTCGRRGCVETYISATALRNQAQKAIAGAPDSLLARLNAGRSRISAKTPFEAARQGDAAGQGVVDAYIRYLAIVVANLFYAYGPEIVLLGGGVCNEGDDLLLPLRKQLEHMLIEEIQSQARVDLAHFKNDAGIIGSAMLHRISRY